MSTLLPPPAAPLAALHQSWSAAWPRALEQWSRHTRLRPPELCLTTSQAQKEGLQGSFAMIRLQDQAVVINLAEIAARGLDDYAVEILAHEIGHHVLAPATLTDHLRTLARMRWALPTVEAHAPLVANLYTDLLINDRLQRSEGLRLADIYRKLGSETSGSKPSAVGSLYLRIYEILWSLDRGSLGGGSTDDRMEGDAWLGARLIRSYARDWLRGSGRFAALLLPHLLTDKKATESMTVWHDTRTAGVGGEPHGAVGEDGDERDCPHPAMDPSLSDNGDLSAAQETASPATPPTLASRAADRVGGQSREPFEYGAILTSAGLSLTAHEVAVRYYRERAAPYLIRFPSRRRPEGNDPLPEGLEPWDLGQPWDHADWLQSVMISPKIIPGLTTVQRTWGVAEGGSPQTIPLDLDLYVDSSGSMPNPQIRVSYLALAGAILCLSALRAGGRVQVTLWSGQRQFITTPGFCRDETAILRVLTGFFGGGTQFPLHLLRDTYAQRRASERPVHVMVISDDGVSTLFDEADEKGNSGFSLAAEALDRARGGGTLVLNLPENWRSADPHGYRSSPLITIKKAEAAQGWNVHAVSTWEDLVSFARAFSRQKFGPAEPVSSPDLTRA
ncbi:MAG TPA: VWA domain-containing protein [Opitutaceae bacterium]|nr:VWA domain-containing protein [Opitutaceae bacterium]